MTADDPRIDLTGIAPDLHHECPTCRRWVAPDHPCPYCPEPERPVWIAVFTL